MKNKQVFPYRTSVMAAAVAMAVGGALPVCAQEGGAVSAEMREQIKRELMADMKRQMSEELKREVMSEIRSQMTEEVRAQMAADIKRQVMAELTGSAGPSAGGAPAEADKGKPRVVRVPYVPESMRREIREQVKQEVLAQAREERWATPGSLPEWLDRFQFEGDVRLRQESFRLGRDNTPPGFDYWPNGLTRAAEFAGPNGDTLLPGGANTQENFDRSRLRLRFGATVKVNDLTTAGFRIATGNSTSAPVSTNQTLGNGFNKYSLVLDRGYITLTPTPDLSLTGGRIANPFFSTDLVWAEDLGFEGVAAKYARALTQSVSAFATAGYFPLRTDNPLQTTSRSLSAAQLGMNWRLATSTELKLGAALYSYRGVEGQVESDARFFENGGLPAQDYGTRYEYPNGLRQRGNTLMTLNAVADGTRPTYWGLASGFRELNLTGSLDIARFDPVHVILTADYVKNLKFDRNEMSRRAGVAILDGKDTGYMAKVAVGHPAMTKWGDWNVSLAYRYLGSDAVLDAFTNSDFGMGGTNNKGYIVGFNWGLDKNSWVTARWMSAQQIDSMSPTVLNGINTPTKFSADLLQIDLNAKF